MARLAEFHWRTPRPTAVDEELVLYDDGAAWLVVRRPRAHSPAIGSYVCRPAPGDAEQLASAGPGPVVIDLLAPQQPHAGLFPALDRVCALARETPEAVATFHGRPVPAQSAGEVTVALLVVGAGQRAVEFELENGACAVHFNRQGEPVAWVEFPRLEAGFITQDAEGLGGLARPAVVEPGAYGAVSFPMAVPEGADGMVVQVAGWLRAALPDEPTPERFEVRTDEAPLGR